MNLEGRQESPVMTLNLAKGLQKTKHLNFQAPPGRLEAFEKMFDLMNCFHHLKTIVALGWRMIGDYFLGMNSLEMTSFERTTQLLLG